MFDWLFGAKSHTDVHADGKIRTRRMGGLPRLLFQLRMSLLTRRCSYAHCRRQQHVATVIDRRLPSNIIADIVGPRWLYRHVLFTVAACDRHARELGRYLEHRGDELERQGMLHEAAYLHSVADTFFSHAHDDPDDPHYQGGNNDDDDDNSDTCHCHCGEGEERA